MEPLAELVMLLGRLPGIGERTATRLAFHILSEPSDYARALGGSLANIHSRVMRCAICGNFGANETCSICSDPRRDAQVLCIVARVQDLHAIERSSTYRGRYHVLHALLSPLEGIGPERIPADRVAQRVRDEGITEVILATPLSVEGEATGLYLAQVLKGCAARISRIASGVPHGGELEFADQVTLGRAFEGRRQL